MRVRGSRVTLDYPGKGGKHQLREIEDAAAARVVRALLADPGPEVFRYRNGGDAWVNVRRRNLNAYLSEITGGRVTAKDFRTWAGSLFGACALARGGYPDPPTVRALKRGIAEAMRETAELLGNTPAVCRASYVSPGILEVVRARTPADRSSLARAARPRLSARSRPRRRRLARLLSTEVDTAGSRRCFLSPGPNRIHPT